VSHELTAAISKYQSGFGLDLTDEQVARLCAYYVLVQEQNPRLHLVAPCPAEEFALRHILESLTLIKYLPENAKLADVGAGAGLPSLPCLLVRDDLRARLIESKEKKARFLTEAVASLGLSNRVEVINNQFIETHAANATHVTCRALDKFGELVPRLVRWSRDRTMLLFAGPALHQALEKNKTTFTAELMPLSERRYLYVINA
jgi:16S rRNA (guanine(527)-N(7))-methyltransferase RsmG